MLLRNLNKEKPTKLNNRFQNLRNTTITSSATANISFYIYVYPLKNKISIQQIKLLQLKGCCDLLLMQCIIDAKVKDVHLSINFHCCINVSDEDVCCIETNRAG